MWSTLHTQKALHRYALLLLMGTWKGKWGRSELFRKPWQAWHSHDPLLEECEIIRSCCMYQNAVIMRPQQEVWIIDLNYLQLLESIFSSKSPTQSASEGHKGRNDNCQHCLTIKIKAVYCNGDLVEQFKKKKLTAGYLVQIFWLIVAMAIKLVWLYNCRHPTPFAFRTLEMHILAVTASVYKWGEPGS